jgi:hypothetical protein
MREKSENLHRPIGSSAFVATKSTRACSWLHLRGRRAFAQLLTIAGTAGDCFFARMELPNCLTIMRMRGRTSAGSSRFDLPV